MRLAARELILCEYCTYDLCLSFSLSLYAEQSRNNKKSTNRNSFFLLEKHKNEEMKDFITKTRKKERKTKKFFHPSPHMWTTTYNKRMFSTWPKQHAYEEWETILCMYIAFLQHELTHLLCSINLICTLSILIHMQCDKKIK